MDAINAEQAVKMIDPTAAIHQWSDCGFWVTGRDWETKITSGQGNAWALAMEMIATGQVAA